MTEAPATSSIKRTFRNLSVEEVSAIESATASAWMGPGKKSDWNELLLSRRILIVSEAGAGKTYECQVQQAKLWDAGEPAFFLDLATLAGSSVRDMLSQQEEDRFDAWLRSQSDVATFFLDSIDELKLTLGKFDQALKRLNKALAGQLGRARIIITTRPVPIDRDLIIKHLPIPSTTEAKATAEAFADVAMGRSKKESGGAKTIEWRNVGLMPLSSDQVREFAVLQGVSDPDALLADIYQRDAEDFATRPQDLIELCADWREHRRIRSHREQVESNITTKLKPNTKRKERAELPLDIAIEGSSRIALAALLTRKLTLRYSADADSTRATEAALDVSKVLPDWGVERRGTLLERPLFGFASYGRVRFHHTSVIEFLAAKRLDALLTGGSSIKSIKRLLFVETLQGVRRVRPSMRPIAAWLALSRDSIFDDVIACEPDVVLDHGDPQSLRPAQRIRALKAYVDRYGRGGWRGLRTPRIQVARFASPELSNTVIELWDSRIENPEVRELLLEIIAAGKLDLCADIAYAVSMDGSRAPRERELAVEALVRLADPRVDALSASVETDSARWPEAVTRSALVELFPNLPLQRLVGILRRVKEKGHSVGNLSYWLPRKIESSSDLSPEYLDQLRQVLTDIIRDGITWEPNKFSDPRTNRPDLLPALIAACRRQMQAGVATDAWAGCALLAMRLSKDLHGEKDGLTELQQGLTELPAEKRESAFWQEYEFLESLKPSRDASLRLFKLTENGGISLNAEKDSGWIRRRLSDQNEHFERREIMLWAQMTLLDRRAADYRTLLESLTQLVMDEPRLTAIIERRLKADDGGTELKRMEAAHAERIEKSQQREARGHASWVRFWHAVVENPDAVFAEDLAENTAWNLWRALARSGQESRASGWNRRFIEEQFGKAVADRLRQTMMVAWRKDRPTLRSERPDSEKSTFLVKWQFGLAGIAAESEDPNWARRLTEEEAELACRYAPIELNGFPSWLESLAVEHPGAVDRVLGEELSASLRELASDNRYSAILQNVSYASEIVAALFIPRIRAWLEEMAQVELQPNNFAGEPNLRQAVSILIASGTEDDRELIESIARKNLTGGLSTPFAAIWLSALFRLNAEAAVDALEAGLVGSSPSQAGLGAQWFATLFSHSSNDVGFDLSASQFSPPLLLRLLRLAYQHVRVEDDVHREGHYTPDTRDEAQDGRNSVLSALLSTGGPEGWAIKLEMANDSLFSHFRDRAIALAQEKAAAEVDNAVLSEAEFITLDVTGESPPSTTEAMFAVMRDRLDDVDDLLRQDISPRELWAGITEERVLRRELARVLRDGGNRIYTIDQESVTGDEKETDIRFRSTGSNQQGTIELKLGGDRSGSDLFNTIRNQLLAKYMAAEDCRAGCLVVSVAKDRKWKVPPSNRSVEFAELISVLNEEAQRISEDSGGEAKIMAKGLDLRPRLRPET